MASRAPAKKAAKKKVVAKKKSIAKKKSAPTKKAGITRNSVTRLREIILALPEAHEVEAWGEPTFRVRNKMFATYAAPNNHHGAGREAVWINATHVTQDLLLRAKPDRYFRPPYVGVSGWVGAWLDGKPDWTEIAELLRDGYRQRAGKRLAARLDDDS